MSRNMLQAVCLVWQGFCKVGNYLSTDYTDLADFPLYSVLATKSADE
jgi:hypothetical protein